MKQAVRQSGFSLMEVMFGVVVLALGLVFVACQFPVAISQSRDVLEMTTSQIDAHNSGVILELRGDALPSAEFGSGLQFYRTTPRVHLLYSPNVRVEDINNMVVMDDPCDLRFSCVPDADPTYLNDGSVGLDKLPPHILVDGDGHLTGQSLTEMVLPTVTMSDPAVQELLGGTFDPLVLADYFNYLYPAMRAVALERKYCSSTLYQCLDPKTKQYRLFTFVLRRLRTDARFPIQDYASVTGLGTLGPTEDRRFPVPWEVQLALPVDPTDLTLFPAGAPWDRFTINNYTLDEVHATAIANLLRVGAPIVDAVYGHVYRVREIKPLDDDLKIWEVRVDQPLHYYEQLSAFWTVPPAITQHSGDADRPDLNEYRDDSPVVSLTQKVVSFE